MQTSLTPPLPARPPRRSKVGARSTSPQPPRVGAQNLRLTLGWSLANLSLLLPDLHCPGLVLLGPRLTRRLRRLPRHRNCLRADHACASLWRWGPPRRITQPDRAASSACRSPPALRRLLLCPDWKDPEPEQQRHSAQPCPAPPPSHDQLHTTPQASLWAGSTGKTLKRKGTTGTVGTGASLGDS